MPSEVQTNDEQNTIRPFQQKLVRILLAVCIIVAPLLVSGWFTLCPQYGNPACPAISSGGLSHVLDAYQGARPILLNIFLFFSLVAPYVYPLSYIGIGVVAMRRSFWLAFLGIICGWLGSIPWSAFADQASLLNSMAHLRQYDASFTVLVTKAMSSWVILAMATGWVLGHVLAYILLGIALLRGKTVPRWAAWLLIICAVLVGPIAYGTNVGLIQDIGYVLIAIGSIPIAIALVRQRHAQEPKTNAKVAS